MATLSNPKLNAINIYLWIIDAHKEKLNEETSGFGANQNIYFAWMRHDSLKTEAAFSFDTGFTATVGDNLRLSDPLVV